MVEMKTLTIDGKQFEVVDAYAREHLGMSEDYVTPQKYGAKADGVTDDTAAIQAAIDSGKPVFFPKGTYNTYNTITISGSNKNIYADNSIINYQGSNYAFNITAAETNNLYFGEIKAANGGCVSFISTSGNTYIQYINLSFNKFTAKTNCIYANCSGGWINEIRINNGRFEKGECGINLEHNITGNVINHWIIRNVGIEGVTTGFYFNAVQGSIKTIFIESCRSAEAFTTLIKTIGEVAYCRFIGSCLLLEKFLNLSNRTDEFYINAPICDNDWGVKAQEAIVMNGVILLQGKSHYANSWLVGDENGNYNIQAIQDNSPLYYDNKYFGVSEKVNNLYLSNKYGRKYGINDLILYLGYDTGHQLNIYDYNNNLIFSNNNLGWSYLQFRWVDSLGWMVNKLENVNMGV